MEKHHNHISQQQNHQQQNQQQNLAVSNYRTSAATMPKKRRQSNSSSNGAQHQKQQYQTQLQHLQHHQQQIQQYYNSSGAGRSNFQACYSQQQQNSAGGMLSSGGGSNIINKTHRSSKDSLGSIAKEHSTTANMIGDQSHLSGHLSGNHLNHQHSQQQLGAGAASHSTHHHTGNSTLHMVARPPPSARNQHNQKLISGGNASVVPGGSTSSLATAGAGAPHTRKSTATTFGGGGHQKGGGGLMTQQQKLLHQNLKATVKSPRAVGGIMLLSSQTNNSQKQRGHQSGSGGYHYHTSHQQHHHKATTLSHEHLKSGRGVGGMLSPKRAGAPQQPPNATNAQNNSNNVAHGSATVTSAKQLLKKVTANSNSNNNNQQRSKSKDSNSVTVGIAKQQQHQHQNQNHHHQATFGLTINTNTSSNLNNKLTKATSQKALSKFVSSSGGAAQKTSSTVGGASGGRTTAQVKKPTPSKQRCETTGSEIIQTMETPTSIQPPISSSTMINASRRKFISTPRNATAQGLSSNTGVMLAQTLLPSKSSLIQRQLSNKLLSPVTTTSRTNKQHTHHPTAGGGKSMLSPSSHGGVGPVAPGSAAALTSKGGHEQQQILRAKSHVKTFSLPNSNHNNHSHSKAGGSSSLLNNQLQLLNSHQQNMLGGASSGGVKTATQFETLSMGSNSNFNSNNKSGSSGNAGGTKAVAGSKTALNNVLQHHVASSISTNSGMLLQQPSKTALSQHQYTQSLQSVVANTTSNNANAPNLGINAPLYATSTALPQNQSLGSLIIKVPQNSSAAASSNPNNHHTNNLQAAAANGSSKGLTGGKGSCSSLSRQHHLHHKTSLSISNGGASDYKTHQPQQQQLMQSNSSQSNGTKVQHLDPASHRPKTTMLVQLQQQTTPHQQKAAAQVVLNSQAMSGQATQMVSAGAAMGQNANKPYHRQHQSTALSCSNQHRVLSPTSSQQQLLTQSSCSDTLHKAAQGCLHNLTSGGTNTVSKGGRATAIGNGHQNQPGGAHHQHQQQNQTMVVHHGNGGNGGNIAGGGSRLGMQHQRSSGDFSLQTYRHTSQSSQGFISSAVVSRSHQHFMLNSESQQQLLMQQQTNHNQQQNQQSGNKILQRDPSSSKKATAFTNERFSTTTLKTQKSGKKLHQSSASQQHQQQYFSGGKSAARPTSSLAAESQTMINQQADANILHHSSVGGGLKNGSNNIFTSSNGRKGSQMTAQSNKRQQTALSELDEDGVSNRSGKTHIIDEVLHQQKTEAYRDLQRNQASSGCSNAISGISVGAGNTSAGQHTQQQFQYGMIVETSSMGQIIEQDDEMQELSVDREDIAHELETTEEPDIFQVQQKQQQYPPQQSSSNNIAANTNTTKSNPGNNAAKKAVAVLQQQQSIQQQNSSNYQQPQTTQSHILIQTAPVCATSQNSSKNNDSNTHGLHQKQQEIVRITTTTSNINDPQSKPASNNMTNTNAAQQNATETLRMLTNKAKTALNHLNSNGGSNPPCCCNSASNKNLNNKDGFAICTCAAAGGTAFSIRKKSNDTVLQAASGGKDLLLPKKSQLANLLVSKPSKMVEGSSGSQLLQRNSQHAIIADGDVSEDGGHQQRRQSSSNKNKSTLMPQGLISESLVNSYLTGSGSMAGQSHKWMCSSKSAKNVMTSYSQNTNQPQQQLSNAHYQPNNTNKDTNTVAQNATASCSLGPKSELKQTEQANAAENTIKIMNGNVKSTGGGNATSNEEYKSGAPVITTLYEKGVSGNVAGNSSLVIERLADDGGQHHNQHYQAVMSDGAVLHHGRLDDQPAPHISPAQKYVFDQLSSQDQQGLNTPQDQQQPQENPAELVVAMTNSVSQLQEKSTPSKQRKSNSVVTVPFGPKQQKTNTEGIGTITVSRPGQLQTAANVGGSNSQQKPQANVIQAESFKSTMVDYTESMNENQITRLTLEQSREMLIQACKTGDLRTVRRLAQIDKTAVNLDELVNNASLGGTPLHFACNSGHVDIAELLIRKMNSRVDSVNANGETPLHMACNQGHKGIIERLLLARASTNIQENINGNTPLHVLASVNHQKIHTTTPVMTGMSDTIRQTMESVNIQNTEKQSEILEDFAVGGGSSSPLNNPRLSLIELILPFAEDSKSIANYEGLLPWQCTESETIASMLQPIESPEVQLPVTASQIQGQGNQDGQQNNVITRNHSVGHKLNLNDPLSNKNHKNIEANSIEVKHVSEDEIANIFTFYKAQKTDEAQNPNADKQFTFQATQPSVTLEQLLGNNLTNDVMNLESTQSLQFNRDDNKQNNNHSSNYYQKRNDTNQSSDQPMSNHQQYAQASSASEIQYATLSSKESITDSRNVTYQARGAVRVGSKNSLELINEQEKKSIQNFLDEDINQIDHFLSREGIPDILTSTDQQQYQRSSHYDHKAVINTEQSQQSTISRSLYKTNQINNNTNSNAKERNAVKRRKTEQNLTCSSGGAQGNKKGTMVSSQFLTQMQQDNESRQILLDSEASKNSAAAHQSTSNNRRRDQQTERSRHEERQDTPALQQQTYPRGSETMNTTRRKNSQQTNVTIPNFNNSSQQNTQQPGKTTTISSYQASLNKAALFPQKQQSQQQLSSTTNTFDKQANKMVGGGYSTTSIITTTAGIHQQHSSPQKKVVLKAAHHTQKQNSKTAGGGAGLSNQTIDSSKSGNNVNNSTKVKNTAVQNSSKQLAKNRTLQNFRPQQQTTAYNNNSAQSQSGGNHHNKSTARLKLAEIVQPFDMNNTQTPVLPSAKQVTAGAAGTQHTTSPTNQKGGFTQAAMMGRNTNQLQTQVNQGNLSSTQKVNTTVGTAPNTLQKTHSSKTTTLMRAASSALDLKQKVDKQAGLLMQRSSSRQILTATGQSEKQIRIGPDQFIAHQLLGTGSFGEVFLVERKQDKKLLAMKVLSKKKIKRDNLKKYAITERNVMCSMGEHPFIVQLRYAFQTKDHLFLISDYCPGGDLSQYLEIEECFSEDKARLYIQEILLGIEALHKQNIIFRDLKPDNVIIDKKGHAMLTDFGLSRENVRRPTTGAKSFCGSYAYLAPEMLDKKGHGKAVDWYLLGVILFEMVTGLPPYYADDKEQLFKNIMRDTLDMPQIQQKQQLSDECIDLMQKLLKKDPATRIGTIKGAIEIRQHPFFRNTDWDVVLSKTIPMPEPYLANMAMDIIVSQPYLVAGHPHTVGDICPRQHRSYLPGWSFTQAGHANLTESQVSDSEKLIINKEDEKTARAADAQ